MKEIFKSNNLIEVSWVKHILKKNEIDFLVMDEQMSINEGNIKLAIPIRILVKNDFEIKFRRLIEIERKNLKY